MSGISPEKYTFHQNQKKFKAGKYLIVDPCYVIGGDPFWQALCNYSFPSGEENRDPIYVTIGEYEIFCWGTAYGDGCYPVSDGSNSGNAGVDAGMLSVVPMEFIEENNLDFGKENGVIVTLEKNSIPYVNDGNLTLGNITAITKEEEDEEYCSQCGDYGNYLNWDGICRDCEIENEENEDE